LAAHWRSKADAYKVRQSPAPEIKPLKSKPPVPPVSATEVPALAATTNRKTPKANLHVAPSIAPSLVPNEEQAALDAIWQALHSKARSDLSANN
jgi:hypothetical protein